MTTIDSRCDLANMDNKTSLFESDKCIVGVSQFDENILIITDNNKVVKYELDNKRVIQEWRIGTGGTKLLTCGAVHKDDRFFAAMDIQTIVRWKSANMYIDQHSKKFKVIKHCHGLIEHMNMLFVLHYDGSLSLFGDAQRIWCHSIHHNMEVIAFNKVHKNQSNCDIFVVLSDKANLKIVRYEIHIQDQQPNVITDTIHGCQSLLAKFTLLKPLKIMYLDALQCVAYGTLNDTKEEGIYMLNARQESIKCCMLYDAKSFGDVVQMMRLRNTILLVTTKRIIELDMVYRPPLLCNLIDEYQNDVDVIDGNSMECEVVQGCEDDDTFAEMCERLRAWLELKNISLSSEDSLSVENSVQEFFISSGTNCNPNEKLKTKEILAFIPYFCKNSLNLKVKVFVEMISYLLSLKDNKEYKQESDALLNTVLECGLPDDILRGLSLLDFSQVKVLLEHLYKELLREELDMDRVVDWICLLLDSHHTQMMLSKDWEVIAFIKQHVDALCNEAKEFSAKRFMEKLKYTRMQKRAKCRRGCYIEMFEL